MKSILPIILFIALQACQQPVNKTSIDLKTHFEKHPNQTVTYQQGISYWQQLDAAFSEITLIEFGDTDSGKPLHIAILSNEKHQSIEGLSESKKPLLFINNAIHAGEPCGVDATMMFYRDILQSENKQKWLNEVNIVAITMYNVGGVLNRNSTTRTNQNGPEEYGFRGNAKNLDLNRDFIKSDSKNAHSFQQLFSLLNPDVFIDNHTTNGADYQHIMTLIHSLPEHYEEPLRSIYEKELIPYLYDNMLAKDSPMIPYVNFRGETPFEGIAQFNDLPRYSMGYASLFNSLAFTAEAHMLKSYEKRVWATYDLMNFLTKWMTQNGTKLQHARDEANTNLVNKNEYTIEWELDNTRHQVVDFCGFEFGHKPSEVSKNNRLFYDQSKPVQKKIKFWNAHKTKKQITKPKAYIIPYAYENIANWFSNQGFEISQLGEEKSFDVTAYQILNYNSPDKPYEGHFLHRNVEVETINLNKQFSAKDYIIYLNQKNQKCILETLEPQAPDSFFAWNYFDSVLQQKEYFSPYVFEDEAAKLLLENPEWRAELEAKKEADPEFANNSWAQLFFVFKKSDRYEKTVNLYPVYRLE